MGWGGVELDRMGFSRAGWDGAEYFGMRWGVVECCRSDKSSPPGLSAGSHSAAAALTPSAVQRRVPAPPLSDPPVPGALCGSNSSGAEYCGVGRVVLECSRWDSSSPPGLSAGSHSAAVALTPSAVQRRGPAPPPSDPPVPGALCGSNCPIASPHGCSR